MAELIGRTVREILKDKLGRIRNAPLDPGSPSWDDILDLSWEEVLKRAIRREPGYQKIHKLLSNGRFDK